MITTNQKLKKGVGGSKELFLSDCLFPINLVSVLTKKACLALMDCFPLGAKKKKGQHRYFRIIVGAGGC